MNTAFNIFFVLVLGAGTVGVSTLALADPDIEAGRALAQKACANCHVVTDDETFTALKTRFLNPNAQGPDFSLIAANTYYTEGNLRTFLMSTHRDIGYGAGMPSPRLANYQIEKIVSFILSLREKPQ